MEEKTIIALEIGSSKIKGAAGIIDTSGSLSVKAVEEEFTGDIVRYGCIRNVVETTNAVRNVISRLEQRLSPRRIEGVYLSVGGRSLTSETINMERRMPRETEVTPDLIESITNEVTSTSVPDRSVVGITLREILVDGTHAPKPIGMMGSHIEARLNLISCRTQLMRNLAMVIEERLGLKIHYTFVRPLAEAELVLFPEEKKLGCMFVDFGAETTTVAIYKNGVLVHLVTLPLGSRNITRDITTLNHLEERAEQLKIQVGSAIPGTTEVPLAGIGQADVTAINNLVAARAAEIILNICEQLKYAGLTPDKLAGGIVTVGRGARLNGFNQRLEQLSGMKVRLGTPGNRIRILDPRMESSDAVDVISILAQAASANDPAECLSKPEPVVTVNVTPPVPEVKPEVKAAPVTEQAPATANPPRPVATQPQPEKPHRREKSAWSKMMDSFRSNVEKIFNEDEDD
ncbi:MAG: hypothetical protein HFJ91_05810 [Muribaculaceae bacterium]|nr:hypothetical protein [Muribaculaceae bacterium]